MVKRYTALVAAAIVGHCVADAQGYTSSFGIPNQFLPPTGWSVGDAGATYQEWNFKSANSGNLPDQGYDAGGAPLTQPTHSVLSPGFVTSTSNFYSAGGNAGVLADIYNHGGAGGTHVMIQLGAPVNSGVDPETDEFYGYVGDHTELVAGHGFSAFWDTLQIVDLLGAPIAGGDNTSALHVSEVSYAEDRPSPFGLVAYQELIFEFWLPGYTGDFRVEWEQIVHSSVDTLRVDTMIAAGAGGGGTPFPLTGAAVDPTPGDFNADLLVDAADYAYWRENGASPAQYDQWLNNYGANYTPPASAPVPEPSALGLIGMLAVVAVFSGWVEWFIRPRRQPSA